MKSYIADGIYYEDGVPVHRGVVKVDGTVYYAGHGGKLAVGHKIVHGSMANGIIKRGTYTFDENGKLIKGSYAAPEKKRVSGKSSKSSHKGRRLRATYEFYIIVLLIVAIAVLVTVRVLSVTPDVVPETPSTETTNVTPVFVPPVSDGEVYLCSAPMIRFYKGEISLAVAVASRSGAYAPFTFSYQLFEGATAVLKLDGVEYNLDPASTSLTIDNLMTGKTYQYTVTVTEINESGDKTTSVYEGSFATASTNRFITLPGVLNTRDIGGYMTSYGKRVRQGLLIRGTEIDGLVESGYFLTDKSAAEPFDFKFDFDLRSPDTYYGKYKSRLGDNVGHKFYSSPQYGGIFSEGAYTALREIFADLSDVNNYPMYLHCTYGADRTGTIVFLLQGILGVSEEDMKFEYGLTGFMISGYENATNLNGIYGGLEGYEGDTINEKIENFLIDSVGVTEEQIENIRSIFLED